MKIKNIIFAFFLSYVFFTGCKEMKEEIQKSDMDFEEYSLAGASCQFCAHDYNSNGKIFIINSEEELKNYIICEEGNYPSIDFSKYTLLYAWDGTTSGIYNISKKFQQLSNNEYNLYVDVTLDMTTVAQGWSTLIKVKKLSQNATVKLVENIHH